MLARGVGIKPTHAVSETAICFNRFTPNKIKNKFHGASGRSRTCNDPRRRRRLYPLSYGRLSVWHARKELNPQPSALEAPALPIELPTYNLAETVGFEPTCRVNDAFLSREAFSATQARLHIRNDVVVCVWCRPPDSNRFLRIFSAPYAPAYTRAAIIWRRR